MSLAQRLKEAEEKSQTPRLSAYEQWFESQDDQEKKALLDAVVASRLSMRELFEIVTTPDPNRPDWEPAKVGRDKFGQWLRANGYVKR